MGVSRTLPPGERRDVTVLGADALERIAALRERRGDLPRTELLIYDVQR